MKRVLAVVLAVVAVASVFPGCGGESDERAPFTGDTGKKVLIIGFDGLDWGRFERLASEGRLPNLAALADSGASGVLRSVPPYVSPTIWTSIATGKLGEKHGIGGFTVYGVSGADSVTLISSKEIRCRTLWEILADSGMSSGIVGWLVAYPPLPVTDYTVTSKTVAAMSRRVGRFIIKSDIPLEATVHPPELWGEIEPLGTRPSEIPEEILNGYLGKTSGLEDGLIEDRTDFLADRLAADLTAVAVAEKLIPERPTRLTAVYMAGCDQISHFFWRYWEPESWKREDQIPDEAVEAYSTVIDRYYENVDEMAGRILRLRDGNTIVVVCSDHGFAGHRGHSGFEPTPGRETAFGQYMHRQEGVIIVHGPGIAAGERIEGATILDVTPTVLAALGLPAARDMDGRPLASAFEPSFLDRHPIDEIATYETGERAGTEAPAESPVDEEEKELLRSLGYID
ncbi:MAG: hypothetical protein GF400_08620 [Candidatus Eisenbacteria bacterium]|nr:hypothetical protein [Candidatus Eisenbacteria bacterium]